MEIDFHHRGLADSFYILERCRGVVVGNKVRHEMWRGSRAMVDSNDDYGSWDIRGVSKRRTDS